LKGGLQTGFMDSMSYGARKWGYILDPATPSLPASVNCPLEVAAGTGATCTVDSMELVSGTWYVDGVAVQSFTAVKSAGGFPATGSYTVTRSGAGNRQVRVQVKYKDGTTEMRDVKLIKFK